MRSVGGLLNKFLPSLPDPNKVPTVDELAKQKEALETKDLSDWKDADKLHVSFACRTAEDVSCHKITYLVIHQSQIRSWQEIYYGTRSTQRAQTSLAEADHHSHILPTVKMLSLGCERLLPPPPPPPLKKKKKKKVLDHYLHHNLDMLPLLRCLFAHLLILHDPDHHQNLISSSLYYSGPLHKILSQSVHNFLSNVVHRLTNQRYQKHNLLCQGGNKAIYVIILYATRALREHRPPWPRQLITPILPRFLIWRGGGR